VKVYKYFSIVATNFFILFLSAAVSYSAAPTASFTAHPVSGDSSVPVAVQFTDNSSGTPTTWFWDFGDGSTSTDQDPIHAYYLSDTYLVTLTATNGEGQDSVTENYLVSDCYNLPVMLESNGSYFDSIMTAYTFAVNSGLSDFTLKLMAGSMPDMNLDFDADASVVLKGGYDCSFIDNFMLTSLPGTLTISAGTVAPSYILFSGLPDCADDADGDGATSIGSCAGSADDCDDSDPNNFPGNVEICDGLDNNCDGQVDDVDIDNDGDGFTAPGSCYGSADDCNDNDSSIYPGAPEVYGDHIDADCDGHDLIHTEEYICFGCHGVAYSDAKHSEVKPPDSTCVVCHAGRAASIRNGHYGRTVMTTSVSNNMTAGQTIRCISCHDWHDAEYYTPVPGADIVWAKVDSAFSSPSGVVDCLTCHETLAQDHESGTAHNHRVIDSLCANCHTSDTTVLGQPGTGTLESDSDINALHFNDQDGSECTKCHAYNGTKLDPAFVAQAILDGFTGTDISCLTCHGEDFPTIHAFIDTHNALVNVGDTSCGNCHSDPPPLVNATDPKVHNACSSCHDANYDRISLAAGKSFDPGGDCTTCHVDPFGTVHPPTVDHTALVTVGSTSCGNCHTSTLLVDPADPKVHNGCTTCHDSQGGLISLAAGKSFGVGGDCSTCHTDPFATVHPADTDHSALVTTNGTQCGNCHTSTLLVDDTDPKVHNGCTTCHDTDGGLVSLAFGKSFTAGGNCTTCHSTDFSTIHPATIDHTALVTVGTASCGNCHHDQPPLVDNTDPKVHNACTTCHDAQGGLVSLAAGKSFDVGGDCRTCHTDPFASVHPSDTDHSGIITTTGTQCGNCHSNPPPLTDDTDPKVHDSCSTCHDIEGGLINLASGKTAPGNCNTCHGTDFTTIHPSTVDHSTLVTVAATTCGNCHSDPPPLVDSIDHKVHNACTTCHNTDGGLVSLAAGKSFTVGGDCSTCHTDPFATIHPDTTDHSLAIQLSFNCASCHTSTHLVDPDDPTVHDACNNCHDVDGALIGLAAGNTAPNECITCHGEELSSSHHSHAATPGSDFVVVWPAGGGHDDVMPEAGVVYIECSVCHNTAEIGFLHANQCAICHLSPVDTLGTWDGGCQQGGCHPTRHDGAVEAHWPVEDDCVQCHTAQWVFPPPASSCANCHEVFDPADTEPPVTISDVQPFYIVPISIDFTVTDGGMVGVGTTFFQLDGGPTQIGGSLYVDTVGFHTLEFWSIDQAGNAESPHNTVIFEIAGDVAPPITESDAFSSYYNRAADITLSATDNSYMGPKATYYIIDSGPTQTGTAIHIPQLADTHTYTLEYWSEDWSGNIEPINTVEFTVYGKGTISLVWGDSDIGGNPPGPGSSANWEIRRNNAIGQLVASGSGTYPGWSGVDDYVVSVSLSPYYVYIKWWVDDYYEVVTQSVYVSNSGDVVRISY